VRCFDLENVKLSKLRCPKCKDKKLEEFGGIVVCSKCKQEFNKKSLNTLDEDDILSNQEMKWMLDSFKRKEQDEFIKKEFWED